MRLLFKIIAKIIAIPLYLVFGLLGLVINLILGLGTYASSFVISFFVLLVIISLLMTYWPGVIVFGMVIGAIFLVLCTGMILLITLGNMRDFFGKVIVG